MSVTSMAPGSAGIHGTGSLHPAATSPVGVITGKSVTPIDTPLSSESPRTNAASQAQPQAAAHALLAQHHFTQAPTVFTKALTTLRGAGETIRAFRSSPEGQAQFNERIGIPKMPIDIFHGAIGELKEFLKSNEATTEQLQDQFINWAISMNIGISDSDLNDLHTFYTKLNSFEKGVFRVLFAGGDANSLQLPDYAALKIDVEGQDGRDIALNDHTFSLLPSDPAQLQNFVASVDAAVKRVRNEKTQATPQPSPARRAPPPPRSKMPATRLTADPTTPVAPAPGSPAPAANLSSAPQREKEAKAFLENILKIGSKQAAGPVSFGASWLSLVHHNEDAEQQLKTAFLDYLQDKYPEQYAQKALPYDQLSPVETQLCLNLFLNTGEESIIRNAGALNGLQSLEGAQRDTAVETLKTKMPDAIRAHAGNVDAGNNISANKLQNNAYKLVKSVNNHLETYINDKDTPKHPLNDAQREFLYEYRDRLGEFLSIEGAFDPNGGGIDSETHLTAIVHGLLGFGKDDSEKIDSGLFDLEKGTFNETLFHERLDIVLDGLSGASGTIVQGTGEAGDASDAAAVKGPAPTAKASDGSETEDATFANIGQAIKQYRTENPKELADPSRTLALEILERTFLSAGAETDLVECIEDALDSLKSEYETKYRDQTTSPNSLLPMKIAAIQEKIDNDLRLTNISDPLEIVDSINIISGHVAAVLGKDGIMSAQPLDTKWLTGKLSEAKKFTPDALAKSLDTWLGIEKPKAADETAPAGEAGEAGGSGSVGPALPEWDDPAFSLYREFNDPPIEGFWANLARILKKVFSKRQAKWDAMLGQDGKPDPIKTDNLDRKEIHKFVEQIYKNAGSKDPATVQAYINSQMASNG